MSSLIPVKVKEWAGLVVSVLVVVLGAASAWGDLGADFVLWTGRIAMVLVVVSNVLGLSVPSLKAKAGAGLSALLVVLLLTGCPNAYRAGWVATASTIDARNAADVGVKKALEGKARECVAKYGDNQIDVQSCIWNSPEYKIAKKWVFEITPIVNTAIRAAKSVLEIAEKVQATKGSATERVKAVLKDGVCAIIGMVSEWKQKIGEKLPAEFAAALKALEFAKAVCK